MNDVYNIYNMQNNKIKLELKRGQDYDSFLQKFKSREE
jgi:hypothetical protein